MDRGSKFFRQNSTLVSMSLHGLHGNMDLYWQQALMKAKFLPLNTNMITGLKLEKLDNMHKLSLD